MILDEVISDEYLIGRNIFGTKLDEIFLVLNWTSTKFDEY
jgi:hypothetical protein